MCQPNLVSAVEVGRPVCQKCSMAMMHWCLGMLTRLTGRHVQLQTMRPVFQIQELMGLTAEWQGPGQDLALLH